MAGRDWGLGVLGLFLLGCATSADPAPTSNNGGSGSGAEAGSDFGGEGGDAQGGSGAGGAGAGSPGGNSGSGGGGGGSGAQGGSGAGGSSSGGSGAGGDGGSSSGGSGAGGASGSAGQSATCPSSANAGPETVLDDVEDGDDAILSADGRAGYWFSYKDDLDSGSMVSTPAAMTPGANSTTHAIQVTGKSSSAAEYGPGFGFPLLSIDVGGSSTASLSCPYDVSSYSGISLWLKATGVSSVAVLVPTSATTSTAEGGTCATNCDDHFAKTVSVSSSWAKVDISFASLAQGGWGAPASFDAHGVNGVGFAVPPGVSFEVWVDELTLTP
ncbi:MAG: carbohydrate binding domain-containing protein [Polyangiaceae bacterium]